MICRQLEHPNIIRLLDLKCPTLNIPTDYVLSASKANDSNTESMPWLNKGSLSDLYFVFEFMETDMYKLLHSPQFLTTQHIAYFVYQLLAGLCFLPSANVIPRYLMR